MSDQPDVQTAESAITSTATQELTTTVQSATGDTIEEGIASLYAAVSDIGKVVETFAGSYATSKSLRNDLDGFVATIRSYAEEIGRTGVAIEDASLRASASADHELESHAGEIEREVAEAIDALLGGPDLSLRERFEELRKRLTAGETGFVFTEKDPFQPLRNTVAQICASIH